MEETSAIGSVETVARHFLGKVVVCGQLDLIFILLLDIFKDGNQTNSRLAFENHWETILQSVVLLGIQVVKVSIANLTNLSLFKDLFVFLVEIEDICTSPELDVIDYPGSLVALEVIKTLQHLKAVEGHDTSKTVPNHSNSPIV